MDIGIMTQMGRFCIVFLLFRMVSPLKQPAVTCPFRSINSLPRGRLLVLIQLKNVQSLLSG